MLLLLFVFLLSFRSTTSSCPSSCSCSTRSAMSSLNCKAANLTSVPVITEESGIIVKVLILDGNNLTKLLNYEFTNAGFNSLVKLSLRNCNMKILPQNLFHNLTNLQDLNLSGNLLSQLLPNCSLSCPS